MRSNGIGFIVVFLIVLTGCSIFQRQEKSVKEQKDITSNEDYYYAFTEACKQKVFGNIDHAEKLYMQCLSVKPNSSAVYYQLSKISILKGDANNALQFAEKAYRLDQNNYWYALNNAQINELTGNNDTAIIIYKGVFNKFKQKINIGYRLASLYEQNEEYDKALKVYNTIETRTGGEDKRIILSKVGLFIKKNKYEKAIEEIKSGLIIYPDDFELLSFLAKIYSINGQENKADDVYEELIALNSKDIEILYEYIMHLIRNTNDKKALIYIKEIMTDDTYENDLKISLMIELFNTTNVFDNNEVQLLELCKQLKSNTDNLKVNALLVDCYIRMDSLEKASNIMEDISLNEKNNYVIWEQLVTLKFELDNYEKVIEYADSAIKYFPNEPSFYMYKGFSEKSLGLFSDAAKTLSEGLAVTDDLEIELRIYSILGDIYYQLNEYQKSDSAFNYVLKYDSTRTIVLNNYSYYLSLRNEKLDKAEELMKKCLEIDSTKYSYLDTYGWVLYKQGKYKQAEKYIRKALNMGGNQSCEVLEHYADVLMKLRKYENALEFYNKALKCTSDRSRIEEKIKKIDQDNE